MDINTQLQLEQEMIDGGIRRYMHNIESAEKDGRASETGYARLLMKRSIAELSLAVVAAVEQAKRPGVGAKFFKLLDGLEPEVVAYITLQAMFDSIVTKSTVTSLGKTIGKRLDDELRFRYFETQNAGLFDSMQQMFKDRGTSSYRHKHRVLVHKMGEEGIERDGWTAEEHLQIGCRLMDLACNHTGMFTKALAVQGRKTVYFIDLTQETKKWISEHNEFLADMFPHSMPCVIPPRDWTSITEGGYYSGRLAARFTAVKGSRNRMSKEVKANDFSNVLNAINIVQRTAWEINTQVLEIAQMAWKHNMRIGMPPTEPLEIPPCPIPQGAVPADLPEWQQEEFHSWKRVAAYMHTEERKRISKVIRVSQALNTAEKFRQYPKIYFVYQCDFRGRMYAKSSGLSPQDTDVSKGLIRFAEGKPLGERGGYWLCVHIANKFGFDKAPYDERVKWVEEHRAILLAIADDPIANAQHWENADCPYQFLAAVFEYAQWQVQGPSFISKLPISLDGSCNGLQNFSAMLRDHVGGSATNLTPQPRPADIYTRVAERLVERLRSTSDPMAVWWLQFGISRELVKRPVMTLPYGASITSFRDHIMLMATTSKVQPWPQDQRWAAVCWLAAQLWSAIGEVVIAAMGAMAWLQKATRIACKANQPIRWRTPLGFLVEQADWKMDVHRVQTKLCGTIVLVHSKDSDQIDVNRMCNGVSPNFVHSMDACHMMHTVLNAHSKGVKSFALIHDDYGTHACDTETLHYCIRESFRWLYSHDVLQSFKESVESQTGFILPPIPPKGQLVLEDVQNAAYFFG